VTPPPATQEAIRLPVYARAPSVADPGTDNATAFRLGPLAKRIFDVGLAAVLLLAMIPLFVLVALAIKLDSRGPVFYRVRRVGYRGAPLMMLKFRKMRHDATGGPLTTHGDPRFTRVGAILTRTKLDELPQLWDVLRGRMSIIGPRPEDPRFVALHRTDYERILSVRPGITGLSQLAYAEENRILDDDDPVEDYLARIIPQKLTLDKLYARSSSPRLDLSILRWTIVGVLLRRPVAVHRASGRMNLRRRPKPRHAAEKIAHAPAVNGRIAHEPAVNGRIADEPVPAASGADRAAS